MMHSDKQVLSGLRVLDFGSFITGPYAAMLLAEMGADVVKVERPGFGDPFRAFNGGLYSSHFQAHNRNKRSVALEYAAPGAAATVESLLRAADVLVLNVRPGVEERLGLSYAQVHSVNPRLVYCSITGFGQTGPYRERAGYDYAIQGMGGLMSVTGEPDGVPGGGPQKTGVAVADLFTGMYATIAVLAALTFRERTGQGQHIDLALLDTQVAMLANQNMNFLTTGRAPERRGNAHPNIVPYQAFATADGHVILAVGNDAQFRRFCALAGCAGLADDSRFAANRDRVAHRAALIPLLEPILRSRTTRAWIAALEAAGVPCGPINRLDEVFADPQVRHRGMRIDLPHPEAGSVPLVANPIRLSASPLDHALPPPLLGQDTADILRNLLGLPEAELARLSNDKVIGTCP